MEFEKEELLLIKVCIEERQRHIGNYIKDWENTKWDNMGSMQNMFINEQAFNDHKKGLIENWKRENNELDNLLERIYEEI